MRMKYVAAAILAASLFGRPAAGQSAADLLQKGIYNQETVGNLDAAIQIYRQVVASGAESRNYAAQAQYRLGVCLLKKGDNAGAVEAFEQLIADYPEQKELVAKARENMPADFKLLPAPWADGELLEYQMKLGGGKEYGTMFFSVEPNPARPQNLLLQNRAYAGGLPAQRSRIEVERESMRPVSLNYFNLGLGETQIDYDTRQARVLVKGKEAKLLPLDGLTFDNEETTFLVRRLPLAAGYKIKLPLVSPIGASVKLDLTVLGIEDVQVPAGKFHCYKFQFEGINQTFWVAMDAPRPIVKFEIGAAVSVELASMRRVDPLTPVAYRDAKTGLAVTAAPGWVLKPNSIPQAEETSVQMMDPEVKAYAAIWGQNWKCDKATIAQQLRASVDEKAKTRADIFKDYRVRPESVQLREIAGQQALSCIADYVEGDRKMIEYTTWVQTENSRCSFYTRTGASEFDEYRKRFDPIIESVRLK